MSGIRNYLLEMFSMLDMLYRVRTRGAFGEFEITLNGKPFASDPRTWALTVFSAMRAIVNRAGMIVI